MRRAARIELSPTERRQLEAWAHQGPPRGRLALRSRIVLESARGATNVQVARRLRVHAETAARWRSRFVLNGLEGVSREAPRAGGSGRVPPALVRRIVRATLATRPSRGTTWTTRSLARSLKVNHMLVHRVWTRHGLGNRRLPDPDGPTRPWVDLEGTFVTGAARAVVFTVEERHRPAQAAEELPELLPNPTGRPEFSQSEELSREVVRAVGALEAGPAEGGTHQDASLLVFLRGIEQSTGGSRRLEVVFDRSLARLGPRVARWLASHARFRVFTPSRQQRWSEAVEAWLRRWEPAGLARNSLRSVPALTRRLPPPPSPNAGGAFHLRPAAMGSPIPPVFGAWAVGTRPLEARPPSRSGLERSVPGLVDANAPARDGGSASGPPRLS